MNEIFSEHFARKKNLFTLMDPRIKMISIIGAIVTVMSSHASFVPFIVTLLIVAILFNIKIPFKIVIIRLSAPLAIAIMALLVKIFFLRQTMADGVLIMSKIIGSTSLVLLLSMTTTVDRALAACRWFKIPDAWVEICLIAYRYIFVLLEDAVTIFDAQRLRLGYTNLAVALRSIGVLSGAIVIRAYDQSIATYEAMMLRGYKGTQESLFLENRLRLEDVVMAFILITILALLIILNQFFKI